MRDAFASQAVKIFRRQLEEASSFRHLAIAVVALLAVACTPPVRVVRLPPLEAQLALTANVLTTGKPSDASRIVLRKYDLLDLYDDAPNEALSALRQIAIANAGPEDELFALAELSYAYAEDCAGPPYYLAASLYAYALLFPGPGAPRLQSIDSRVRIATDIYNRSLAEALERKDEEREVRLTGGVFELPFGVLEVAFDERSLSYGEATFKDFLRISDYDVEGFRNRYRKDGIGAPLAPHLVTRKGSLLRKHVPRTLRVPSTALLRVDDPRGQLASGRIRARLEFYAFSSDVSVTIDGRKIPLESEPTATFAASLADSRFWKSELARFLGRTVNVGTESNLIALEPGRNRIPVVFVHGTNSSSARWADMVNDLINDPRIHRTFSFWFFNYMSSQPIALSARELRNSLTDAVAALTSHRTADCLPNAVVIGHSQGGLLTKMLAIHSGDRFWRRLSDEPFADVELPSQTRKVVEEALFVEPLPFVKRVVFIATPHRGSFLAGPQIVRRLIERLVTLPIDIVSTSTALARAIVGYDTSGAALRLERVPTSIDNMSPGNVFIQSLSDIPVAPAVIANSIIPVKPGFDPYQDGNDGVVRYKSAHIDDVESELVVRSAHSTQSNPHTIEEVRRILLRHAEQFPCNPLPLAANVTPDAPEFDEVEQSPP